MKQDREYTNNRNMTLGGQRVILMISVEGNVGKATGQVLMRAIDDVFNRLRVTQTQAEVIPHE